MHACVEVPDWAVCKAGNFPAAVRAAADDDRVALSWEPILTRAAWRFEMNGPAEAVRQYVHPLMDWMHAWGAADR